MYKIIKTFIHRILILIGITKLKYFRIRNLNVLISKEKREFIKLNSQKWSSENQTINEEKKVLIEGFFASSGPNYLIRTSIIAKAILDVLNLKHLVLFKDYLELEHEKIELYKSFKFDLFESEKTYHPKIFQRIYLFLIALRFYGLIKSPEDLLKLKYKGILFGDLLYDTILKDTPGLITIERNTPKQFFYILKGLQLIFTYQNLLNKTNIGIYVSTHSQYLGYGLLLRICIFNNIPVIETTDIQLWLHQNKRNVDGILNSKYHEYLNRRIKLILNDDRSFISMNELETMLNDRFLGNFEQSDVRLAYKNKKLYSKKDLNESFQIKNNYPFVYIFAHVFADAPQGLSNGMLYRDYFTWLEATIKEACNIEGINWIVKPHPANSMYNEAGLVEDILSKQKGTNIFLCPPDFSPASVIETALAVITAQGTVGIEYSCMGIPAVLASNPFYSGYGFTFEPQSIEEYKKILRNISTISKLTADQIVEAKKVFAAFMKMQQTDTSLIDTDLLYAVWGGNNQNASPDKAYEIINARIKDFNFEEYSLFKQTKELIKKELI